MATSNTTLTKVKKKTTLLSPAIRFRHHVIKSLYLKWPPSRFNQFISGIHKINQVIIHEKNPRHLLQNICDTLTKTKGYTAVWISFYNYGGNTQDLFYSYPSFYSAKYQAEKKYQKVPFKEILANNEFRIISNPLDSFPDLLLDSDCKNCGLLTSVLKYQNQEFGIIVAACPMNYLRSKKEHTLFRAMCCDISYAIHNINVGHKFQEDHDKIKDLLKDLKVSNAQKHTLFESIPDMVLVLDTHLRVLYANKAALDLNPDAVGKFCYSAFTENSSPCENCTVKKALETGSLQRDIKFQNSVKGTKGKSVWENTIAPVRNEKNEISSVIAISKNITQRTESAKELEKYKERLELAMDAANHSFWDWDILNDEVFYSSKYWTSLGYKSDEFPSIRKSSLDLLHPEDRKTLLPLINRYNQVGKSYDLEFRLRCRDGSWKWVNEKSKVYFSETGKLIRIVGSLEDITHRKIYHDQLKTSRRNFKNTLESLNELVIRIDTDFTIRLANKAASHMLSIPREKFIGSKCYTLLYNTRKICDNCPALQAITTGTQSSAYRTRPDGKVLDRTVYPVFNEEDEVIGATILASDITLRKRAENKLQEALQKAQESDRLKTAFLTNMSHEIRTPMNGIMGFATLLENPDLSIHDIRKYLSLIKESGKRMLNTINDIVDMSKIESGGVILNKTPVDVNALMKKIYDFFRSEAELQKLEFIKFPANGNEPLWIETDSHKLYAILENLVKNALKYTEEGYVHFGYKVKQNRIHFFVKDTGIGIPEKNRESVFNRFEQVETNSKRVYEGSGLGLSISKAYVEMLDGKIHIENNQDQGSIFKFFLPVEFLKDNFSPKDQHSKKSNPPFYNLNVLIAEDDDISRLYIREALKKNFTGIQFVSNGEEAVEFYRKNPKTDLILMDMRMPVLNGYEATRKIRELDHKIIIIAQTAYAMHGDRKKALDAGCNDYITKPIKREELFRILNIHFNFQNL